jgi:hypothetical protein
MSSTDMSAGAVTRRLRKVSELRRLCLSLAKAEKVRSVAKTIHGTTNTVAEQRTEYRGNTQ